MGSQMGANGVRPVGRAEAMVAFFLRAPADLEFVGRGGSTTITFVAKQLNHGLSLPTKRSGLALAIHLPNAFATAKIQQKSHICKF